MNREQQLEELVRNLLEDLNVYNQPDMLDGYLNQLGHKYNMDCLTLNLPCIQTYNEEEE